MGNQQSHDSPKPDKEALEGTGIDPSLFEDPKFEDDDNDEINENTKVEDVPVPDVKHLLSGVPTGNEEDDDLDVGELTEEDMNDPELQNQLAEMEGSHGEKHESTTPSKSTTSEKKTPSKPTPISTPHKNENEDLNDLEDEKEGDVEVEDVEVHLEKEEKKVVVEKPKPTAPKPTPTPTPTPAPTPKVATPTTKQTTKTNTATTTTPTTKTAPPPIITTTPAKSNSSPAQLQKLMADRKLVYLQEAKLAKDSGDQAKLRQLASSVKKFKELEESLKSGQSIDETQIPPALREEAPSPQEGKRSRSGSNADQNKPATTPKSPSNEKAASKLEKGIVEGWVQKKGDDVFGWWRNRWFVLQKHRVVYYPDKEGAPHVMKEIRVSDIKAVKATADLYFQVETRSERIYYLYSTSKQEASNWVSGITKIMKDYRAQESTGGHSKSYARVQQKKLIKQRLEEYKKAGLKARREKNNNFAHECDQVYEKLMTMMEEINRGENIDQSQIPPAPSEKPATTTVAATTPTTTTAQKRPNPAPQQNVANKKPNTLSPTTAATNPKQPATQPKAQTQAKPTTTTTTTTPVTSNPTSPAAKFVKFPEEALIANDIIELEKDRVSKQAAKYREIKKEEEADDLDSYLTHLTVKLMQLQADSGSGKLSVDDYVKQLKNRVGEEIKLQQQCASQGNRLEELLAAKRRQVLEKEKKTKARKETGTGTRKRKGTFLSSKI